MTNNRGKFQLTERTHSQVPGQPTDSNRAARREIKRQQQRQQRKRPFARIAKNGFGGDS